jgi:hypothetical protein
VNVNVLWLEPSAVTKVGLAPNVVVVPLGAPPVKVTVVVAFAPPARAVTVFTSAVVDANVAVNTPEASVIPALGVNTLLPPVLDKLTDCAGTTLPDPSFTVTVSSVVLDPSAVTEVGLAINMAVMLVGARVVTVTVVFNVAPFMVADAAMVKVLPMLGPG